MCVRWPCLWLAIDEVTSTSTSTGATAFRAEMNRLPRRLTERAASGATRARAMPQSMPMKIRMTRLVRLSRCRRVGAGRVMSSIRCSGMAAALWAAARGADYAGSEGICAVARRHAGVNAPAVCRAAVGAGLTCYGITSERLGALSVPRCPRMQQALAGNHQPAGEDERRGERRQAEAGEARLQQYRQHDGADSRKAATPGLT
ncbi:hypothetical protein D3C81_1074250 [compost metagenome]